MDYVERDQESNVRKLVASSPCMALTGPRQSGKSTLLRRCLPNYRYETLDDPLLREQATTDPLLFLENLGERAIIDEIQYAPGLLTYVKMHIDRNRARKGIFVFTGSQQFALIKGLGESLAGRIALAELLPFSVTEKRRSLDLPGTEMAFRHAALVGSYPELVTDPTTDSRNWYASYVQTYLERDIRSIYDIGKLADFQRFLRLLAARTAQQVNMSDYARDLGITVPTVKKWLSILEASRIVYLLPPYYANSGKRITKAPKSYFLDIGLVCYLAGVRDEDHLFHGPMAGALFENFCIQEAVKRSLHRGFRPQLYYIRTGQGLEVDLLIEPQPGTLIPVEFKMSRTPSTALAKNIADFRGQFSGLGVSPGHVVTLNDEERSLTRDARMTSLDTFLQML